MNLTSKSFQAGQPLDATYAFCKRGAPVELAANRNPHLSWSGQPAATKSFALVMHDCDVPSEPSDVNKEGHRVAPGLARVDFTHWLLANIPCSIGEIEEGSFSSGVVSRGKSGPEVSVAGFEACLQGLNDYTGWFAGDDDMAGSYYGYDGPCPPWTDPLVHRYIFTLYALDLETLELPPAFTRADLLSAIAPHLLAETSLTCTYSLYLPQ